MDNGEMRLPSFTLHGLPTLVDHLGIDCAANIPNPITYHPLYHPHPTFFISPTGIVLRDILFDVSSVTSDSGSGGLTTYHHAGPRREVTFDPVRVRMAIVTSGGLCPGTNTVVRELVVGLWELQGVCAIFGVRNGYHGFYSEEEDEPLVLYPATVHRWHKVGDAIDRRRFNQVYAIGGNCTMHGLVKIFQEVRRRGLPVAVAGVLKTVDNNVGIIDRSFGLHTAVEAAVTRRPYAVHLRL